VALKRHSVIRTATGEQLTQAKGAAITQDHPARAILALRSIGGDDAGGRFLSHSQGSAGTQQVGAWIGCLLLGCSCSRSL